LIDHLGNRVAALVAADILTTQSDAIVSCKFAPDTLAGLGVLAITHVTASTLLAQIVTFNSLLFVKELMLLA
jgi:branched-subunit amino acid transport protein